MTLGQEEVMTMLDVLEVEQEQEDEANAVLGGASETVCSYSSGYMARQPLYACTTCSQPDSPDFRPAGVCLACSYQCHEGHTLVELYTKREFRCDCGTSRLAKACRLQKEKEENTENRYNQNFSGLYCECHRPYPDPEDPVTTDCMVQCVVCEDWYHGRHLGVEPLPEDSSYAEMVCRGCVTRHSFLQHYTGLAVTKVKDGGEQKEEQEEQLDVSESAASPAPKKSGDGSSCPLTTSSCSLTTSPPAAPCSLFLPGGWRAHLCTCSSCTQVYKESGTSFLCREDDTVHHYESQAKETQRQGGFEKGMDALGQMDRVAQVEVIHSYNNMKENLMEYLAKFAGTDKVVREEDIREFFEGMKANKKQKTAGGPPPSCK